MPRRICWPRVRLLGPSSSACEDIPYRLVQNKCCTADQARPSVHDGDIIPMLAALNLFPENHDLPTSHVVDDRGWKTSQVTPMGGRVIFERLACSASASGKKSSNPDEETFVRINVNDGIVPFGECHSGPGQSCPLGQFMEIIRVRGSELHDFRTMCGLDSSAPDRITFLHQ